MNVKIYRKKIINLIINYSNSQFYFNIFLIYQLVTKLKCSRYVSLLFISLIILKKKIKKSVGKSIYYTTGNSDGLFVDRITVT